MGGHVKDVLVARVEQVVDLDGLCQGGEGSAAAHGVEGAVLLVADLSRRHVEGRREVRGVCG